MATTHDWTQFTRKIIIAANVQRIYNCWATQAGMESFFLRKCVYMDANGNQRDEHEYVQAGDTYTWAWHNWEVEDSAQMIEANGRDRLVFEFDQGKVSIDISSLSDGRSLVVLRQYEIPTDERSRVMIYQGCSNGWSFWLVNLKAYLEHGILLNEKGMKLAGTHDGMEYVNI